MDPKTPLRCCGAEPHEPSGWVWHAVARGPFIMCSSAFMSPYLLDMAKLQRDSTGNISWLGIRMLPTSYVAVYSILAAVLSAMLSPLLGALADYSPYRKRFAEVGTYTGAAAGVLLISTTEASLWWFGGVLFVIMVFAYESSLVFIYAYLPEIGEDGHERTRLSAWAVAGTNVPQLLLMAGMTIALAAGHEIALSADGGRFETSSAARKWKLVLPNVGTNAGTDAVGTACLGVAPSPAEVPASGPVCWWDDHHSFEGAGELHVRVPAGTGNVSLVQDAVFDSHRDRSVVLSANVASMGAPTAATTSPAPRVAMFVRADRINAPGVERAESQGLQAHSKYKFLEVKTRVLRDTTSLRYGLVFIASPGAGDDQFRVDDIDLVVQPGFIRPLFMLIASLWWFGFGVLAFLNLKPRAAASSLGDGENLCFFSLKQLGGTIAAAYRHPVALRWLFAVMFYGNGTSAMFAMLGVYLRETLNLSAAEVGVFFLLSCSIGVIGAWLFHQVSKSVMSLEHTIMMLFILWALLPILIYFTLTDPSRSHVSYVFAVYCGLIVGGSTALNRAYFAGMVPEGREAEFMGMYSFFDSVTAWSGTLLFTVINEKAHSMRIASLSFAPFFVLACFCMVLVLYAPKYAERRGSVSEAANSRRRPSCCSRSGSAQPTEDDARQARSSSQHDQQQEEKQDGDGKEGEEEEISESNQGM